MKKYPNWMKTDYNGKFFHFLVPKFHLPAHIMACQTIFSFNFNCFVGRTDGEAPECGWSKINPITISTAEMGPGHHRDTLDDHFGDGNWKKTTLMGESYYLPSSTMPEQFKPYHCSKRSRLPLLNAMTTSFCIISSS